MARLRHVPYASTVGKQWHTGASRTPYTYALTLNTHNTTCRHIFRNIQSKVSLHLKFAHAHTHTHTHSAITSPSTHPCMHTARTAYAQHAYLCHERDQHHHQRRQRDDRRQRMGHLACSELVQRRVWSSSPLRQHTRDRERRCWHRATSTARLVHSVQLGVNHQRHHHQPAVSGAYFSSRAIIGSLVPFIFVPLNVSLRPSATFVIPSYLSLIVLLFTAT